MVVPRPNLLTAKEGHHNYIAQERSVLARDEISIELLQPK